MAFALVQSNASQAATATPSVTLPGSPTPGNLLVATLGSVTTAGNVGPGSSGFTQVAATGATSATAAIFARMVQPGDSATVTLATANVNNGMTVTEWSGIDPAYDPTTHDPTQLNSNTVVGPVATIQPGSITPAVAGELFIAVMADSSAHGGSLASDSSYVIVTTSTVRSLHAYKISPGSGAENPNLSWLTAVNNIRAVHAAFKPATTPANTGAMLAVF